MDSQKKLNATQRACLLKMDECGGTITGDDRGHYAGGFSGTTMGTLKRRGLAEAKFPSDGSRTRIATLTPAGYQLVRDLKANAAGEGWGLRWREFGRNDRIVTKERFFFSELARGEFAKGVEQKPAFKEFVAWSTPATAPTCPNCRGSKVDPGTMQPCPDCAGAGDRRVHDPRLHQDAMEGGDLRRPALPRATVQGGGTGIAVRPPAPAAPYKVEVEVEAAGDLETIANRVRRALEDAGLDFDNLHVRRAA